MSDNHRRFVISEQDKRHAEPGKNGTGLDLSDRPDETGFCYDGLARRFDLPEIRRSEWQGMIEERKQRGRRIIDWCRRKKYSPMNQQRTNYCWIFAPTHGVEIARMLANEPKIRLSPAWAGSIIKGGRNVGGWGREAIRFLAESGTVPVSRVAATDQSRRNDTRTNRTIAKGYRVTDWMELRPRNLSQMVTTILSGYTVAVGYNWWGHEVLATDLDWIDNDVALIIRNSWGGWGDYGFGVLQGSRMLADDAVACISARPKGAIS